MCKTKNDVVLKVKFMVVINCAKCILKMCHFVYNNSKNLKLVVNYFFTFFD